MPDNMLFSLHNKIAIIWAITTESPCPWHVVIFYAVPYKTLPFPSGTENLEDNGIVQGRPHTGSQCHRRLKLAQTHPHLKLDSVHFYGRPP